MIRVLTILLVLVAVLAACGESDEEKAQNAVCDARADIQERVDDLAGLDVTSVSIDRVTNNLEAIGNDLETIAAEREDLSSEQRAAVEEAGDQFRSELEATAQDVVAGATSGDEAGERIGAALDDLASAFRNAYGPVDCD
jgi:hypothetical protein